MNDIAIKVSNLSKVYKLYDTPTDRLKEALHPFKKQYHNDFYALNDISFEIKKGETVGIIGKNGAGKSTLLKIITGVLSPSSGNVQVDGRISSLLELGAGFNPEYTGIENIHLQGTLMGYSHEEMQAKIDDILAFADIGDFIHQPVKSYSSGMFARLAFAVAINVEPNILIVDEALSVGDAAFQQKCFKKFKKFQEMGKSILFVSHSTQQIIQYCSKAILLHQGKIIKLSENVKQTMYDYEVLIRNTNGSETINSSNEDSSEIIELDFDTTANKSTNEHRFGTHEAIMRKVVLTNDPNSTESSPLLTSGEKAYIKLYILSQRYFESIVLGVSIKNKEELWIWGDNTEGIDISLKKGLNLITMSFDLNIVGGEYFLHCGMADISCDPRVELDQRWSNQIINIVTQHRTVQGFAYAPTQVRQLELKESQWI